MNKSEQLLAIGCLTAAPLASTPAWVEQLPAIKSTTVWQLVSRRHECECDKQQLPRLSLGRHGADSGIMFATIVAHPDAPRSERPGDRELVLPPAFMRPRLR
jgi:hypothetical protein